MAEKHPPPQSFLIRITGDASKARRIMLVRVSQNREQHYFASLDDLMIFFLQEFEQLKKRR